MWLAWDDRDAHPAITILTVLTLMAALTMVLFGQPPLGLHGPLHYLGVMSPTCGLSRGVMWFARGDLLLAWEYNPASLLVIPIGLIVIIRAAIGHFTGRWLKLTVQWNRPVLSVLILAVMALTIRQQLHVELLM